MHRPTVWRATISQIPSTASRRTGRRFASSFVGRATGRATGTLLRWGLAGAAVYYYNTASVFADEPRYANQSVADAEAEPLSLDAIAEQRRAQAKTTANVRQDSATVSAVDEQTPEGLEEEAAQQGAFNEETGEINWDCPCLGGMANGPCGEHFKTAFSCFVFSKEEPKGVDCIEHFKAMQNCFREYPDIYGAELEDEEEAVEDISGPQHAVEVAKEKVNETVEQTADAIKADATSLAGTTQAAVKSTPQPETAVTSKQPSQVPAPSSQTQGLKGDESSDVLVPRSWHDSTNDNDTKSSQQK